MSVKNNRMNLHIHSTPTSSSNNQESTNGIEGFNGESEHDKQVFNHNLKYYTSDEAKTYARYLGINLTNSSRNFANNSNQFSSSASNDHQAKFDPTQPINSVQSSQSVNSSQSKAPKSTNQRQENGAVTLNYYDQQNSYVLSQITINGQEQATVPATDYFALLPDGYRISKKFNQNQKYIFSQNNPKINIPVIKKRQPQPKRNTPASSNSQPKAQESANQQSSIANQQFQIKQSLSQSAEKRYQRLNQSVNQAYQSLKASATNTCQGISQAAKSQISGLSLKASKIYRSLSNSADQRQSETKISNSNTYRNLSLASASTYRSLSTSAASTYQSLKNSVAQIANSAQQTDQSHSKMVSQLNQNLSHFKSVTNHYQSRAQALQSSNQALSQRLSQASQTVQSNVQVRQSLANNSLASRNSYQTVFGSLHTDLNQQFSEIKTANHEISSLRVKVVNLNEQIHQESGVLPDNHNNYQASEADFTDITDHYGWRYVRLVDNGQAIQMHNVADFGAFNDSIVATYSPRERRTFKIIKVFRQNQNGQIKLRLLVETNNQEGYITGNPDYVEKAYYHN